MTCDLCGKLVDPGDAHYPHWDDCDWPRGFCDCDLLVCPDCCLDSTEGDT